jgi:hypothetical protein
MEEWVVAGLLGLAIGYTWREGRRGIDRITRTVDRIPLMSDLVRKGKRTSQVVIRNGTRLAKQGIDALPQIVRTRTVPKGAARVQRVPIRAGSFLFFCDPDGNSWAVQQLPPGS